MKSNANGAPKMLADFSNTLQQKASQEKEPAKSCQQQQPVDNCKIKLAQQMHPHGGGL